MKKNPVVHFEMPYKDDKRVSNFYSTVFGWDMNHLGEKMNNYITAETTETDKDNMVKTPGNINGGFFRLTDDIPSPYPSVVIHVENIKEAIEKIKKAGGKVLGQPMDIPGVGQYVSFMDTEGNRVSVLEPKMKN